MSRRGLLPVVLAVGFGVANGYIIFNPAFQNLEVEKLKRQEALEAADLGPNMIEISVKDPSSPNNAPATTADTGNVKDTLTVEGSERGGQSGLPAGDDSV